MLVNSFRGGSQKQQGCLSIRTVFEKGCLPEFINGKLIINSRHKTGIGFITPATAGYIMGTPTPAEGLLVLKQGFS
jgi:hypothetical protein